MQQSSKAAKHCSKALQQSIAAKHCSKALLTVAMQQSIAHSQ
jgi:hypothetical protein